MDLEENGYVQKRIRFFMDVLVNELLMRNIQLPFLV